MSDLNYMPDFTMPKDSPYHEQFREPPKGEIISTVAVAYGEDGEPIGNNWFAHGIAIKENARGYFNIKEDLSYLGDGGLYILRIRYTADGAKRKFTIHSAC